MFWFGGDAALGHCLFVLLALADIDIGFTLCDGEANLAVLCVWEG